MKSQQQHHACTKTRRRPTTTSFLSCAMLALTTNAVHADLYFSEYVEGSSNNKALEIYNNGESAVNLAGYNIFVSFNGGSSTNAINLNGTVAAGDVFVLARGNCGDDYTLISAIQGSGASSPLVGTTVNVEAIVTADLQDTNQLGGFFLQQFNGEDDGNAATSEGIYVAGTTTAVNEGDRVRVTGSVAEIFGMTQITATAITVCGSGPVTPTPATINFPVAALTDLEAFEGMRVNLPQILTVTENYHLGRFGQVLLSNGRLQQPTNVVAPGVAALALQAQNNLNQIMLDDGSNVQNPATVLFPAPGLAANNTLRSGDSVAGVTGVLAYDFGEYRVYPTQTPEFVHSNPRPAAPAAVAGSNLKVASFNVLNFFNGDGFGGGFPTARGANTAAELARQKAKTVSAILGLDADIVGLIEIENDGYGAYSAIAELVNALNAGTGATTYAYVNPGVSQIGTDAIAVGLIYRSARVGLIGAPAILDSSVDPLFIDTKNRPVLAQTFRELVTGARLTVSVSHLKSKGSDCLDVGDADVGDGQGNCNLTRTEAAHALVSWLASDPTNSGDDDFLIIGDLNSYALEDPISAIIGAGYVNLIAQFVGANAYSYVFDGQAGYLDHALASASLAVQTRGVQEWHINADEPTALDYNVEFKSAAQLTSFYSSDAYRSSDHDPVLVSLKIVNDLDGDGDVDSNDIAIVTAARNTPALVNDARDINRDGVINVADARALTLQCTRTRCATN